VKLGVILIAVAAGLAVANAAAAQTGPASASVASQVTVASPTQLTGVRTLDFGTVTKPTTGTTTFTVTSAAAATATPVASGGNGFVQTAGQAHAAQFHLVGGNAQTYSVTTNTLSFTNAAGNLSSVGSEAPVAASGNVGTLPASGTDDLYIGGHFDVVPATTAQAYTGALSLTINFN